MAASNVHLEPATSLPVQSLEQLSLDSCCALWALVFAKPGRTMQSVLEEYASEASSEGSREEQWHMVWQTEGTTETPTRVRVVAAARSYCRVVVDGDGRERRVLALAYVATDPSLRRRGLARTVVTEALSRVVGGDFEAALFQTTVPEFYQKLGASEVPNQILNSTQRGRDAKRQGGFWDDYVMTYPSDFQWPAGDIDLNGPGY